MRHAHAAGSTTRCIILSGRTLRENGPWCTMRRKICWLRRWDKILKLLHHPRIVGLFDIFVTQVHTLLAFYSCESDMVRQGHEKLCMLFHWMVHDATIVRDNGSVKVTYTMQGKSKRTWSSFAEALHTCIMLVLCTSFGSCICSVFSSISHNVKLLANYSASLVSPRRAHSIRSRQRVVMYNASLRAIVVPLVRYYSCSSSGCNTSSSFDSLSALDSRLLTTFPLEPTIGLQFNV